MDRKLWKIWMYSFLAIMLMQCQPYQAEESQGEKGKLNTSLQPKTMEEAISVEYAQNFSIQNFAHYKVAHVHFKSEQRNIAFDQQIVFYPKGQSRPKLESGHKNAWFVKVPIATVAANDDGEITRLTSLRLRDNIIAMGGGGIYDLDLRKKWEEKKIASIGYSFHQAPLAELILALNPDLLMLYAYDHGRLEALEKLRELGINAIPQFAWAEPSILGKAEWLKFTALFLIKERKPMNNLIAW